VREGTGRTEFKDGSAVKPERIRGASSMTPSSSRAAASLSAASGYAALLLAAGATKPGRSALEALGDLDGAPEAMKVEDDASGDI
jgi:hypothetical protein